MDEQPTLQLIDGTDTQIAQDSNDQSSILTKTVKFNFENGNFEDFDKLSKVISNKVQTIRQTILPLVEVALIELLGNDLNVKYESFNSIFSQKNNNPTFSVELKVSTKEWIGTDVSQEAVKKDADYIINRLKVVPNVNWKHCIIDTQDGSLTLSFVI